MATNSIVDMYNIDRKAASKLLKVSIRTVDRYVKAKKVSSRFVDGRIWLDRGEIEELRNKKKSVIVLDSVDMSTSKTSIDESVDNADDMNQECVDGMSTEHKTGHKKESGNFVYKKLYLDTKQELKEKEERLELANYRVGQLESQVRNSIPMLEYHRESYEKQKKEEEYKNKINETNEVLRRTGVELKYEKFNKRLFLIILLTILALQPLWLLFVYK